MAVIVAAGTTISIGGSVACVKSISGPEFSVALIDITCLASTSRQYLASPIPNNGKVSVEAFYDGSAGIDAAQAAVIAGTTASCVITLSDSSTFTFTAFVESFKVNPGSVDEAVSCTIDLQISGDVTIA